MDWRIQKLRMWAETSSSDNQTAEGRGLVRTSDNLTADSQTDESGNVAKKARLYMDGSC